MKKSEAFRGILTAGLVVGVLDISSAFVIWWQRGVGARRGLQGIAAGLLGAKSFDGGMGTASIGLGFHFFVALVVVSIFYLASRKLSSLTEHAVVSGLLYGIAVYIFMYWILVPLVFPTAHHSMSRDVTAVIIHIVLIGLPIALVVRRFSTEQFSES